MSNIVPGKEVDEKNSFFTCAFGVRANLHILGRSKTVISPIGWGGVSTGSAPPFLSLETICRGACAVGTPS